MAIRVLLVDDHVVVRQGLRLVIGLDPELEVVGEAANGEEAVSRARTLSPDVVVMDLLMPVMDGVTATQEIRRTCPETEVVALTSVLEDATISRAIRAGAIGYLLKDTEGHEVCLAIKAAAAGQVQLSPRAAKRLMGDLRGGTPVDALTARETDVLVFIARGLANKEIARELSLSERTVKTHAASIFSKLNVASRTQAALVAIKMGLAPLPADGDA